MAYRERQKISQMTPKGSNLASTDLIEISELVSGSYQTKSITGQEIIDAASGAGGTVTSVDLTMPSAFNVTGNPITTSGTLAVTGAGVVSQYVRGDGSLANFPSVSGGGASTSYYLNGSVNQGTIGGVTYYEMNKTPILGAGTDFVRTNGAGNGYIASFLTDANDPNLLKIPGGNWNLEFYFSASSSGSTPSFYVELYKYDGTTFTLIASNSTNPEIITGGTAIDAYFTTLSVPETILLATDRLAIRVYVTTAGRTITMHTEDNHLSQVITTFTTGLTALNGLTDQVQNFATGTSGTDFGISSSGSTHTFNLPTASATNRGALSSTDWSAFNGKFTLPSLTSGSILFSNGTTIVQDNTNLFWDNTNKRLGVGATPSTSVRLDVRAQGALSTDIALRVRNSANTLNTFQSTGDGKTRMQGSIYYAEFDPATGIFVGNNFGNMININGVLQGTSWFNAGQDGKLAVGKTTADYRLDVLNSTTNPFIPMRVGTLNGTNDGKVGIAFTTTWTGGQFGNVGGVLFMNHQFVGPNQSVQHCRFDFALNSLNTAPVTKASITAKSNILLGTPTEDLADSHTIYIPNGTAPTANLAGGGKLYVEGGALKYRGSSGTITTIANA
jgi:hypothetical protein